MEFYEQKSTTFRNQNGRVRSAFKVVKAKNGVMKSMEGISNKNDTSLYHILQTIRKNNMAMRSRYSIHMDDLKKLLMEGDRMNDYRKIENTPIVRKRASAAAPNKVKSIPVAKSTKSKATTKKSTKSTTKSTKSKAIKKSTKSKANKKSSKK